MADTPFKISSRYHYEDANGNRVGAIPTTLLISAPDTVAAKVTFDDADADKKYVVPPGPTGAVGIRFEDFKTSADGVSTKSLELALGPTGQATGFKLVTLTASITTGVSAQDRMQGLDGMVFGVGQTIAFIERA